MLIFYKSDVEDINYGVVTSIFNDYSNFSEERIAEGIIVESIPEPEIIDGKYAVLYMNLETKEPYYKYFDKYVEKNLSSEEMQAQILLNTEYLVSRTELGLGGI